MKRGLGDWSLLSGPNKDGSRHIGIRVLPDAARQIHARGHIVVNKMYERSVDRGAISNARIGDVFDVRFDGDKGWWVWQDDVRLGRLTWSLSSFETREWRGGMPRIDEGTLQVIRLVVDAGGIVVNAGGIVRPLGDAIPPVKKAVPDAQEYVPTLRAVVGIEGGVRVAKENVDGSPRVGRQPAPLPRSRRSIWERLTGH
ncbi:hypothetical protein [Microbacterium sp.]|uniref:hypothetical protein n=1 Tax=Microbacterium sp. TaxID=51671 RepID=UPI003566F17A